MPRFRLRFLLQEIDLREGDTLLGRSAMCHVTIEDPLVSRQHSRIRILSDSATLEDLSSRNGTFVNGHPIEGSHLLEDGDRIRIGTLELVFCTAEERVRETRPGRRTTGFMCYCADCGMPYPAELTQCATCGSIRRVDDDTLSGVLGDSQRNWMLELLVEVLEKAVALQRWEEVDRMLSRARVNIDGRLAAGQTVDRGQLDQVSSAALHLAVERRDSHWASWALSVHAALGVLPCGATAQLCDRLPDVSRHELGFSAKQILSALKAPAVDPAAKDIFYCLERLSRAANPRVTP